MLSEKRRFDVAGYTAGELVGALQHLLYSVQGKYIAHPQIETGQ
jgi:hypothetical protein